MILERQINERQADRRADRRVSSSSHLPGGGLRADYSTLQAATAAAAVAGTHTGPRHPGWHGSFLVKRQGSSLQSHVYINIKKKIFLLFGSCCCEDETRQSAGLIPPDFGGAGNRCFIRRALDRGFYTTLL